MFEFSSDTSGVLLPKQGNSWALEHFLCDKPTGIRFCGDFTTCACAVHKSVVHGVKGGEGCTARSYGKLPFLAVLYSPRSHHMCGATPATRRLDAVFVAKALNLGVLQRSYATGPDDEVLGLCTSAVTDPAQWGAGYCYMLAIRGDARIRVGRVLGPNPLVVDLLRVLRLVGVNVGARLMVEYTAVGLHVVRDKAVKGQHGDSGLAFVRTLMVYVEKYGADLRIGADAGRAALEWFEERGLALPEAAVADLAVGMMTASMLVRGDRLRQRTLALIGDRVLKLWTAMHAHATGATVEDASALEQSTQTDAALAKLFVASSLSQLVVSTANVDIGAAKVGGTAFEAVVGAVFQHCGLELAAKAAGLMGFAL